jgi:2-C-methyl-D-erythritol 2,4-cyclodiphosphate synthase
MRIGHGFDVHQLVKGRSLVIGGVTITFDRGLAGHSDADVLLHAVMDALLGAATLGDIGRHFPPSDPAFEDADSCELLRQVGALIRQAGFGRIVNIDATIMAECPPMAPHIPEMRKKISDVLNIDLSQVNVKATTTEKLGFVGREEGIAASAVCIISEDE